MRELIKKACQRVRDFGAWDTLRYAGHWISERHGERFFDIDTAGAIPAARLGLSQEDANNYEPMPYASLRRALRAIRIRNGRDVFLDYGSGKGRAVIVAGSYAFRRALGVELSPALHQIALRNLERARARKRLRCPTICFVQTDAATFTIPADVTAVLVYNSFRGTVMSAVVERLRRSLLAQPRPLRLIARFPEGAPNPFEACPWLCRMGEVPAGYSRHRERVLIYRAVAVATSTSATHRRDADAPLPTLSLPSPA